jgi:hypothetical protein
MKKMISLLVLSVASVGSLADDKVLQVYSCGDDVGLYMEKEGWVVALDSQIGAKRVDRIMSIGLTLVASGKSTGYFNAATPISWCGITSAKPITVLAVKST